MESVFPPIRAGGTNALKRAVEDARKLKEPKVIFSFATENLLYAAFHYYALYSRSFNIGFAVSAFASHRKVSWLHLIAGNDPLEISLEVDSRNKQDPVFTFKSYK